MNIDVTKYVGQQIKKYRLQNNMTQKELGLRIGVKHNTISGYENGTSEPEQNTLFALADVFEISINDLFPTPTYNYTMEVLFMDDKEMERIISKNLKKLLVDYNINQAELAKIAKVSESAVGKWILGKSTPRMGPIQRMADHFNLPKSYILTEKPSNLIPLSPQTVRIPILGSIACGEPILAEENIIGYIHESPDRIPDGNVYFVQASGSSMEPTIPNGSHVLIREQPEVEHGEIAAVLVNGETEATLKRVHKQGNLVMLMPDNPVHKPIIITEDNPARIIGKAIRYVQDL